VRSRDNVLMAVNNSRNLSYSSRKRNWLVMGICQSLLLSTAGHVPRDSLLRFLNISALLSDAFDVGRPHKEGCQALVLR
jgi:hypothetical protein